MTDLLHGRIKMQDNSFNKDILCLKMPFICGEVGTKSSFIKMLRLTLN